MLRRLALPVLIAALAVAGAGCGNKKDVVTEAATEGIWLDVGALQYHIQASRLLNPATVPDNKYLTGLPDGILPPEANEVWFAVFLRVENRSDQAHPTVKDFEIVDTQGKVFKPLELKTAVNPFAYAPTTLQPKRAIPRQDSAQEFDSTSGAMLLFKLPLDSYANRPLELRLHSADVAPNEASLDLDV
jgi:hypothetical protein